MRAESDLGVVEEHTCTDSDSGVDLRQVGLPICWEGRLCIVQAPASYSLVSLARVVSENFDLDGKCLKFYNIKSCLLDTDEMLCDAIDQGLTPVFATAGDSAPIMYMEELVQVQFKSVRLQMASLLGRMAAALRVGMEGMQNSFLTALDSSSACSKEEIGQIKERLNTITNLVHDERHLRENLFQDTCVRLQDVATSSGNLSQRVCQLEQQVTRAQKRLDDMTSAQASPSEQSSPRPTRASAFTFAGTPASERRTSQISDLERKLSEKLEHVGKLMKATSLEGNPTCEQSARDNTTPQKKINFRNGIFRSSSLSIPRGSADPEGRLKHTSPRAGLCRSSTNVEFSPASNVTVTPDSRSSWRHMPQQEQGQRQTELPESSTTQRFASRGESVVSEGVCSTISDLPGSVVIATTQVDNGSSSTLPVTQSSSQLPQLHAGPPVGYPVGGSLVAPLRLASSNGPGTVQIPLSASGSLSVPSGSLSVPSGSLSVRVAGNQHAMTTTLTGHTLFAHQSSPSKQISPQRQTLFAHQSSPSKQISPQRPVRSTSAGRRDIVASPIGKAFLASAATTPSSRPGTPRGAKNASVSLTGPSRRNSNSGGGTRNASMSRRYQQIASTRSTR